jgi:hypothetical protein
MNKKYSETVVSGKNTKEIIIMKIIGFIDVSNLIIEFFVFIFTQQGTEKFKTAGTHENNKEYLSEYYRNNREKINKRLRLYVKNRIENDEIFKLNRLIRRVVNDSFSRSKYDKNNKTEEIIGIKFDELKLYLESKFEDWMTWEKLWTI